jgi:hypothetical protein
LQSFFSDQLRRGESREFLVEFPVSLPLIPSLPDSHSHCEAKHVSNGGYVAVVSFRRLSLPVIQLGLSFVQPSLLFTQLGQLFFRFPVCFRSLRLLIQDKFNGSLEIHLTLFYPL